jgi:hypothetical protein
VDNAWAVGSDREREALSPAGFERESWARDGRSFAAGRRFAGFARKRERERQRAERDSELAEGRCGSEGFGRSPPVAGLLLEVLLFLLGGLGVAYTLVLKREML